MPPISTAVAGDRMPAKNAACAAIIGVLFACAGVRIRTSVMAVTVGAIVLGMVVIGTRDSGAGARMRPRQRGRDNAGELGD